MGMKLLVKTGQPLPMATTDDRCGNAIVAGFCGKGDRCTHSSSLYIVSTRAFLARKWRVQENLKSNTWNYVEVGGVLFTGARLA